MIKVITYGTFDLLHQGHINLLKRAKALGDYLIVGVTTENFDVMRGKINVRQSLTERMEAVKNTGIADEVIPEEYVGQKIDDIKRHGVDIFAIGSDWRGKFDYLGEFCEVVYLPRTKGISSSQLRSEANIKIGVVGSDPTILKLKKHSESVNGLSIDCICKDGLNEEISKQFKTICSDYGELLKKNDAIYVAVQPERRYEHIRRALLAGKHVISESPIAMKENEAAALFEIAEKNNLRIFDAIKTAYSLPFTRLILLIQSGLVGDVKNIDVTCTSLEMREWLDKTNYYSSFTGWGSIALLPIFKILGIDYKKLTFSTLSKNSFDDVCTRANIEYESALATITVGIGIKSEGDLRISGTRGYVYVPAPWWKSGYFEARFENATQNKPYYYENDGEGLRMELVQFVRSISSGEKNMYLDKKLSLAISKAMELFASRR